MSQIIVLGMHRSGTSTVTGLLHHMGAWIGEDAELIGSNPENPKGFWERGDVIDCNDAILRSYGCEWFNLADWPTRLPSLDGAAAEHRDRIIERMKKHETWALKDPRMCHTLPYWLEKLNKPILLFVHRHPMAIANSLYKRNRLPIEIGLAIWEACAIQMFNYRRRFGGIEVHYEQLIANPVASVAELQESFNEQKATGLSLPDDATLTRFIDPNLNRSAEQNNLDALSIFQRLVYHALHDGYHIDDSEELQLSREAKQLMRSATSVITLSEMYDALEDKADRALKTIAEHEARLEIAMQAEEKLTHLIEAHAVTQAELNRLHDELNAIKNTRTWKLRNSLVGKKDAP